MKVRRHRLVPSLYRPWLATTLSTLPPVTLAVLLLCVASQARANLHDRYTLRGGALSSSYRGGQPQEPQEYIDPTDPPVLPNEVPACSVQLLKQDFAHTYGSPPAYSNFSSPENCQWNRAVLEMTASCTGEQYDRIAGVWIDGVEVLRTSTAEPTQWGVFWTVRKDVTRYSSLLVTRERHQACRGGGARRRRDSLPKLRHVWVMLENIVDNVYTGIYHLNLTLHFYQEGGGQAPPRSRSLLGAPPRLPPLLIEQFGAGSLNQERLDLLVSKPADLILPVSHDKGSHEGFWFRIQREADARTGNVQIPKHAYRAVLEIYASAHGDDEFWYSNPPSYYIDQNRITPRRGNGAFREVYATIDGLYAGSVVPFPVVFTGGFNPLLWAPVVGIGAFDLPSYSLDVTPFLGILLNGNTHRVGLGVGYGIPFWLVGANLHLWLDPQSNSVSAHFLKHQAPPVSISYSNKSQNLDGQFKLEAERAAHFEGWVRSSLGNLTYFLDQQYKFRSSISIQNNGNTKEVYSKAKFKTDLRIEDAPNVILARLNHKAKYPITIYTAAGPGQQGTYARTNVSHTMYEKGALTVGSTIFLSSFANSQNAQGWMEYKNHSVLSGSASSQQTYKHNDNGICYIRIVSSQEGNLLRDQSSTDCHFA